MCFNIVSKCPGAMIGIHRAAIIVWVKSFRVGIGVIPQLPLYKAGNVFLGEEMVKHHSK